MKLAHYWTASSRCTSSSCRVYHTCFTWMGWSGSRKRRSKKAARHCVALFSCTSTLPQYTTYCHVSIMVSATYPIVLTQHADSLLLWSNIQSLSVKSIRSVMPLLDRVLVQRMQPQQVSALCTREEATLLLCYR